MKNYLGNAFSLNMLVIDTKVQVEIEKISPEDIPSNVVSVIGHPDTARVVSGILGFEVAPNRVSLKLEKGDVLYVAQYSGPRLPEGATQLPEGATLEFDRVILL